MFIGGFTVTGLFSGLDGSFFFFLQGCAHHLDPGSGGAPGALRGGSGCFVDNDCWLSSTTVPEDVSRHIISQGSFSVLNC